MSYRLALKVVHDTVHRHHPEITMKVVARTSNALFAEVWLRTLEDGRFRVPGLGVFYVKQLKERRIRNPATGKIMMLPARWALRFRASRAKKGVGAALGAA